MFFVVGSLLFVSVGREFRCGRNPSTLLMFPLDFRTIFGVVVCIALVLALILLFCKVILKRNAPPQKGGHQVGVVFTWSSLPHLYKLFN